VGAIEGIVTIGTSFARIALFRALTRIERRYRAAWGSGKTTRGEKLSKNVGWEKSKSTADS